MLKKKNLVCILFFYNVVEIIEFGYIIIYLRRDLFMVICVFLNCSYNRLLFFYINKYML